MLLTANSDMRPQLVRISPAITMPATTPMPNMTAKAWPWMRGDAQASSRFTTRARVATTSRKAVACCLACSALAR